MSSTGTSEAGTRLHLVVDGSNIATEGRSLPSLTQLDEAVRALLAEQPYEKVTVVVDATFGHRIDARERKGFEEAVANGELVSPPAGAIGRGDAFVLSIAERANADVLSNDSFQEFHGTYDWLFDEGRLIGGKPVPDVGWVFVLRTPVRGPASRKSVREGRTPRTRAAKATGAAAADGPRRRQSIAATGPMPVPTAPPPRALAPPPVERPLRRSRRRKAQADPIEPAATGPAATGPAATGPGATGRDAKGTAAVEARTIEAGAKRTSTRKALNDGPSYMNFVIDHPLGSVVEGAVDRFSSHGAYVAVGAAHCYVPLKVLGDPPPRSAREVFKLGETRSFVVQRFDPARRGIDVVPTDAAPTQTDSGLDAAEAVAPAADTPAPITEEAPVSPAAKKASASKASASKASARTTAKKTTTAARSVAKKASGATKGTVRKATARKATARKAPAAKAAATRPPAAKKAPAKKAPAVKKSPAAKRAPAAKKAPAKKAPAKKTAAKKATATRAAAKKR